tara:strand:+ start:2784 stop:2999 length:216 start_codon:yes stop_codon:yes gene_type:complete
VSKASFIAKTGLLTDCNGSFASDNEFPEYVAHPLDKIVIRPIKITPIFLIFSPILEAMLTIISLIIIEVQL